MCGICGIVNLNGEPVDEPVLASMAGRLRHRGPDAIGLARPVPWVGLGHTRLKVIDLSDAANQPMASRDGMTWIVYNGEIYNYRELRRELESHDCRFVSRSDTEVILQAYEQWGEACVARLDGMFAFAVFDGRRRRLVLARDRTGKKPLFYYHDPRRFAFASELKALLAHPLIPHAINARAVPSYLVYGYPPAPETFYEGMYSLPPAMQMVMDVSDGTARHTVYWQLDTALPPLRVSKDEAIRGIRDRLTQAVHKRLMSDVPLGAFLSGGVDSSIVVGLMSRLMDRPVHTFSIGFRGDARYDETPYARLVAQRYRSRHTEFIVEPKAFELIERLVYHHDQPFGDASAIPTFLLCQLAKEHVTVALNGDGGDELFAGYRRFQAAVASAMLPPWLTNGLAWGLARAPRALRRHRRVGEALRFCEAAGQPWAQRLVRWVSYCPDPAALLRPELSEGAQAVEWLSPARRWLAQVPRRSPLYQALWFNFHEYLPNDLHVKMDRCSMAHGLETRSPLLDTDVIEYAFGLPDRFKLNAFTTKAILKEAFADLLPPTIRRRGKWGFGVPLDSWFRQELREALGDLLLSPEARVNAYLNPHAIRRSCQAHLNGERDLGLQLWSLLTLEVWLRMSARGAWTDPAPISLAEAGR